MQVNHGVPVSLVDGVRDVTREFFKRPAEEKALIALEKSPHFRSGMQACVESELCTECAAIASKL